MKSRFDTFVWLLVAGFLLFNGWTLGVYPRVFDGSDEAAFAKQAYLLSAHGLPFIDPNVSDTGVFRGVAIFPTHALLTIGALSVIGRLFGFGILAMRLLPLVCSAGCLVLTYRVGMRLFDDKRAAFYAAFALAWNLQFIAGAHAVRPEPLLTALLLGIFHLVLTGYQSGNRSLFWAAAFLAGVSPSVHMNGAIVAPVLLFGTLWLVKRWQGDGDRSAWSSTLALQLVAFMSAGVVVFLAFHYLPYRKDYWHALSFGMTRVVGYPELLANIPRTVIRSLYLVPRYHWDSLHHAWMSQLGLYVFALIGGVLLPSRAHTLLIRVCLVLWLALQAVHFYPAYYEYGLPFISLLLGSVLCRLPVAAARALSTALVGGLPLIAASVIAAYVRQSPAWPADQLRALTEAVGDRSKVLAPYNFFFAGIPPENLYDLANADRGPEPLMKEKGIPYLILYKAAAQPQLPLSQHCRQELVLRQTKGQADQILLFKCDYGGP